MRRLSRKNILMTPEYLLDQLKWRYAVKKFDATKKIPNSVWHALEQSLVLSPSSFGLQPWKFFIIQNPEIRQQLLPHSWGQKQVVDASHLIVLAIKKDVNEIDVDRYIERMAQVQQVPVENLAKFADVVKNFLQNPPFPFEVNNWSAKQVYIALGFFMTSAAILEIDTCPMEGFIPSEYDRILGLTEKGYSAVVVCPAGYRAADDQSAERPKVRFSMEDVIEYL